MIRFAIAFVLLSLANSLFAEEGMFLFSNPPKKAVVEKYGFEMSDGWLETAQKATLRFPNGTGSFVSGNGLIMTNHHIASAQLQALSTEENDLLSNGFYAKTEAEELPCPSLELLALQSYEDVSEKVKSAVKPEMSLEEAEKARRAVIARIEKEATDATGLQCNVVTLYQGGQYHLYRYKKYADVRLVFAPEQQAGSFGGDPDNFEYPRYCLDCAFFRAYEDGKPAATPHHFGWAKENVKNDELVFVSGHPGRTNRAYVPLHLKFQRDVVLPRTLQKLYRLETVYSVYAERSEENKRRIKNELDYIKNSRKVRTGQQAGLLDPALMMQKNVEDDIFWSTFQRDERLFKERATLPNLNEILQSWMGVLNLYQFVEQGDAFPARTFQIARMLVRLAYELEKPNDQRLSEYQDSNLDSLKRSLFSEAPIYEDVEILKLENGLTFCSEVLGATDPILGLDAKSPIQRATELVKGTRLFAVEERKRIAEGGIKAIEESSDPMIKLAVAADPHARKVRKQFETTVDEPLKQAYAKIADWKFQLFGDTFYPDATFTLRLSYGTVKGYTEDDGTAVPPWTVIDGMFERAASHKNVPPFDMPESWAKAKGKLDLTMPFNLVSTNDIIGGNSGSPLFNKNAEVVGLIFDGNLQSLSSDMIYTDVQSRAVSVHAAGIVEALRKVYDMGRIADELGN